MKRAAALSLLLLLAFASSTFAILRPRYPIKADPPYPGQWVVIDDDAIKSPPRNAPSTPQK